MERPQASPGAAPAVIRWRPGVTRPATVVIADDHPVYRDGLARAIAARTDLSLVGEAGDGEQAERLIRAHRPDVALLDVRMPGLDGVELCARVTARRPECRTRVLLLSAFVARTLVSEAVAAGAAGYIEKDASRDAICQAIARVALGGTAFCDGAEDGVVEALERSLGGDGPGGQEPAGRTGT
jgi:two-component system nitrate/nitrite response regulator NarL